MKLKVLGSGSSGNCYLLESENEALLIECGVKFSEVKKAVNFNISKIVGCLVTHEHGDHCKYIDDVLKAGITVYSAFETLSKINADNFRNAMFVKGGEVVNIGDFKILPFDVIHDAVRPLGFLINHWKFGTLLFATDLGYSPYTFKNLNHILIECNHSIKILNENTKNGRIINKNRERIIQGHMGLETCKELLEINDLKAVQNIVLLHLSNSNSNEKEFQEEIQNQTGKPVYIAKKGLELNLNMPF